jgi:hypothetical protein
MFDLVTEILGETSFTDRERVANLIRQVCVTGVFFLWSCWAHCRAVLVCGRHAGCGDRLGPELCARLCSQRILRVCRTTSRPEAGGRVH